MKKIIGILATSNYMETDDPFKDTYRYGNNYIKKIIEYGAIPYLIPLCNDEVIPETLSMCDGLLLPGGSKIKSVNFDVIDYFYKNNKPILGICMGMQTLAMYSVNIECDNKRIIGDINTGVDHWPVTLYRDNVDTLVHDIILDKDSKLYNIIGSDVIKVNSLHKRCISEVGSKFRISCRSTDGIIEGIEYKDDDKFIIGVQFHPEVLDMYDNLFEEFINKC